MARLACGCGRHTNTHADSDTYANSDSYQYADADPNTHADSYSNAYSDTHPDSDTYADAYTMIAEIEKYKGIYANATAFPRYGHSNHGARAVRIIQKWGSPSVLDVGCGYNEFAAQLKHAMPSVRAIGVDPACPGADLTAEATRLPFGDKEFTVVTSFDMLEHLPECEVETALAEMARISNAFIFSISYVPSVNKWKGQTLHPTVRPETWWIEKIIKAGGMHIEKNGRYITGHWQSGLWRIAENDTVAVVGNGPSALRSSYGAIIDAHTHVVRFNNYKVAGYESQVGTRTSLWSSVGIARSRLDPASKPCHSLLIDGETAKHEEAEAMPCERLPRWFYNQVRRELQERSAWKSGFEPEREKLLATSGLLVVAWLLRVKNVKRLTLTGFDHFSKTHSSQHHYWVPSAFKKPSEHDGDAEAAMFADLLAAGRITYL